MTWVKRGGGRGTGIYGGGLPPVDGPAMRQGPPTSSAASSAVGADARRTSGSDASESALAPAYRVTDWPDALSNRVILDVLANWVRAGNEPEMSILFEDGLAAFGAESQHFIAACKGQAGAGAHYQRTVAGGRFRDGG
jgi:hypothetical protein